MQYRHPAPSSTRLSKAIASPVCKPCLFRPFRQTCMWPINCTYSMIKRRSRQHALRNTCTQRLSFGFSRRRGSSPYCLAILVCEVLTCLPVQVNQQKAHLRMWKSLVGWLSTSADVLNMQLRCSSILPANAFNILRSTFAVERPSTCRQLRTSV